MHRVSLAGNTVSKVLHEEKTMAITGTGTTMGIIRWLCPHLCFPTMALPRSSKRCTAPPRSAEVVKTHQAGVATGAHAVTGPPTQWVVIWGQVITLLRIKRVPSNWRSMRRRSRCKGG